MVIKKLFLSVPLHIYSKLPFDLQCCCYSPCNSSLQDKSIEGGNFVRLLVCSASAQAEKTQTFCWYEPFSLKLFNTTEPAFHRFFKELDPPSLKFEITFHYNYKQNFLFINVAKYSAVPSTPRKLESIIKFL